MGKYEPFESIPYEPFESIPWKSGSQNIKADYVLLRNFFGKAIVRAEKPTAFVSIPSVKEVRKKRLISHSKEELEELKKYYITQNRDKELDLVEKAIIWINTKSENDKPPKELTNATISYKLYNSKKAKKIAKYETKFRGVIGIPGISSFGLYVGNRALDDENTLLFSSTLGVYLLPEFSIYNPKKYVSALKENEYNEKKLYLKIGEEVRITVKEYFNSIFKNSSKNYNYNDENLLDLDEYLKNELMILGSKYGIQFNKLTLEKTSKIVKEEEEKANKINEEEKAHKERIDKVLEMYAPFGVTLKLAEIIVKSNLDLPENQALLIMFLNQNASNKSPYTGSETEVGINSLIANGVCSEDLVISDDAKEFLEDELGYSVTPSFALKSYLESANLFLRYVNSKSKKR